MATDNAMLLHSCGHLMGAKFGNHVSDVNEKCPERARLGRLHDFHTDSDDLLAASGAEKMLRPVHVHSGDHVRAHVFQCVLAFHVEWHLRRRLAPPLFEDDDREGARAQLTSPVAPGRVSESARIKAGTKLTSDGLPVHFALDCERATRESNCWQGGDLRCCG